MQSENMKATMKWLKTNGFTCGGCSTCDTCYAQIEERVRERGKSDGDDAGSWVIDGNTTRETAAKIFQGIEGGDPAILDGLPALCLGQWAGDPTWEEILLDLGIEVDEDVADDLWLTYQDAWHEGMIDRVSEDARNAMPLAIKLTNSDDDDGFVTAWCDDAERAKSYGSIEGTRWECDDDLAYAAFLNRPGLVEELQREGYDVDDSEFSEPDDEDIGYWRYRWECEDAGDTPLTRAAWLGISGVQE